MYRNTWLFCSDAYILGVIKCRDMKGIQAKKQQKNMKITKCEMLMLTQMMDKSFRCMMNRFFCYTKNSLNQIQKPLGIIFFIACFQHIPRFVCKLNFSVHYYYIESIFQRQKLGYFLL